MSSLLQELSSIQPPSQEQERAEQENQERIKEMNAAIESPKSVADDYYWDEKEIQNVKNMYKCASKEKYKNYNSKYDEKVKEYKKTYGKRPEYHELYDLCNAAIEEVDNASSSITKLFKNIIFNKKREKEIKETTINKFIDFYKGTLQEDYVEKKGLDEFNTDLIFRKRVLCRCYIEGDDKLKTQVEEFIKKYSIQIDLDNCILKRIDKKEPSSEPKKKDNPEIFRDQLEKAVNIMSTNASERLYNDEDYKRAISILAEAKERMKKRQQQKDAKKLPRLTKVPTKGEEKEANNKPFTQPPWKKGGKRTKKSYKKSKKANTKKHKKSKKVTFKKNKKTRKH